MYGCWKTIISEDAGVQAELRPLFAAISNQQKGKHQQNQQNQQGKPAGQPDRPLKQPPYSEHSEWDQVFDILLRALHNCSRVQRILILEQAVMSSCARPAFSARANEDIDSARSRATAASNALRAALAPDSDLHSMGSPFVRSGMALLVLGCNKIDRDGWAALLPHFTQRSARYDYHSKQRAAAEQEQGEMGAATPAEIAAAAQALAGGATGSEAARIFAWMRGLPRASLLLLIHLLLAGCPDLRHLDVHCLEWLDKLLRKYHDLGRVVKRYLLILHESEQEADARYASLQQYVLNPDQALEELVNSSGLEPVLLTFTSRVPVVGALYKQTRFARLLGWVFRL